MHSRSCRISLINSADNYPGWGKGTVNSMTVVGARLKFDECRIVNPSFLGVHRANAKKSCFILNPEPWCSCVRYHTNSHHHCDDDDDDDDDGDDDDDDDDDYDDLYILDYMYLHPTTLLLPICVTEEWNSLFMLQQSMATWETVTQHLKHLLADRLQNTGGRKSFFPGKHGQMVMFFG